MCLRESCTLLLVVLLFLLQYHCSDAFKIKVFRRKFGEHSTREHLLNTYPDRRRSSKIMYSILTMSMQGKMIESFGRRDSTEQKPPSGGIKSKGANNERKHKAQTISGSRKEVSVIDSKSSGIRVNKCLQTLSRRAADTAIEEGRVTINGRVCKPGDKVNIGDNIRLDGKVQVWEEFVQAQTSTFRVTNEEREHIYLKYWKPLGVVCTCDKREANNIISAGKFHLFPQRLFTVGRLDKDSTGLILVTSDGRVNNALLSKHFKKEKEYEVDMDRVPTDEQIQKLRHGVMITTPVQRDSGTKLITAITLPCNVTRLPSSMHDANHSKKVKFVLVEGRNRQIRRMAEAVGLHVVNLHRTTFAGITTKGLTEGDWIELNKNEMAIIKKSLERSSTAENLEFGNDDEQ